MRQAPSPPLARCSLQALKSHFVQARRREIMRRMEQEAPSHSRPGFRVQSAGIKRLFCAGEEAGDHAAGAHGAGGKGAGAGHPF